MREVWIETVCHNRVLNTLYRQGVAVDGVRRYGKCLRLLANNKSWRSLKNCLDTMGLRYRTRRLGVQAVADWLRRRPAVWVAALVLVLAAAVCSRVVWRVSLDCPDALYDDVYRLLQEERYTSPHWKTQVDTQTLIRKVSEVEGVALASVYVRGVVLRVEIKEELPHGEVQAADYRPIVAACDCIVQRVVVEKGRAMVQAGQSVKAGDVLIAPEYLVDKTADVTIPCEASGTVYGYAYPSAAAEYSETQTYTVRTGKHAQTALICVGGTVFGKEATCPYANSDKQTERIRLSAAVPVEVVRTTWFETQTVTEYRPFEAAQAQVEADCYRQIEGQLKKDVQIVRKWCIINKVENVYHVRAYCEVLQSVGVRYEQSNGDRENSG